MKIGNIDLEEFKSGKIAVNCVSEEDAREFLKGLENNTRIVWFSGEKPTEYNCFGQHKEKTYIRFNAKLVFDNCDYAKSMNYKIIKYEKEQKEMKFSDLKDNWVVVLRSNEVAIVVGEDGDICIHHKDGRYISNYEESLSHKVFEEADIMKVYSTDNGELTLVWERKEPTEKEKVLQQIAELKKQVEELEKSVEGMA